MLIFKDNQWQRFKHEERNIVYIDENHIEFGFFDITINCMPIYYKGDIYWLQDKSQCTLPLYYRNDIGCYTLEKQTENLIKRISKHTWYYPIPKSYNFSKLNLPEPQCNVIIDKDLEVISDFTIGLEYETSSGNIPWLDCQKYGLVPLYDGSITGHEYVTFPLQSNQIPSIKEHLNLLNKYTEFDQNCSLHVHFGNFPITYNKIYNLVKCWRIFQNDLLHYLPEWSYTVERYKDNRKAYNKPLNVTNLKLFYEASTGNVYENDESFYLPNLYDEDEHRKWEVQGRYHNLNIMHLIAGKNHKTVEFRFLRPTYNYSEIKWFLLVFGAFLKYVKDLENPTPVCTVTSVLNTVYPIQLASKLINMGIVLRHLSKYQSNCNDRGGINLSIKSMFENIFPIVV